MEKAMIFGTENIVTAEEVKQGKYSRLEEFVDPEYQFKVEFVKGSRNNGRPYFRLYYSYEEYKKLFPERADRYQLIANMRHFEESKWHKKWKDLFSSFCDIEHYTKNSETNKWKFADAFFDKTNTCFEFQHSYIAQDFEERNQFYEILGIHVVWLYDLSKAQVVENKDGFIDILEDNARGFFRVSENPENLRNHPVFIQVKSGMIYRVNELLRRDSAKETKSTIRCFNPTQVFSEQEFVELIKCNREIAKCNFMFDLRELWSHSYKWIVVEDTKDNETKMFNADNEGELFRSFKTGLIQYKYVTCFNEDGRTRFSINSEKDYNLRFGGDSERVWRYILSSKS